MEPSDLNVSIKKIKHDHTAVHFPKELSESQLLTFLKISTELSADEVFWMRSDSEIFYVNQAACDKLGYQQHELVGMHVWEWDPLFPKEVWPAFWQQLIEKKHIDFETQHQNRQGEVFPVRIKGHLVEYGDEQVLFAFVTDISGFKSQELRLEESKQQVSALLEHEKRKFEEFVNLAPVGIAINRLDTGCFEYVNAEFSRFSGYTVPELNAMDYWQLTPKKYAEQEQQQLQSMEETSRYGPYRKEYIHKDGHSYPVVLSGVKITDTDGEEYIWSVVQDISSQLQYEIEINKAKEQADLNAFRMQLANDSAGIGVWEWDLTNNVLVWDDWMYQLYGVPKEQFSGAYEAWENSVHPDDIAEAKAKLESAVAGTAIYDPEFRVVRPDGDVRTIKASAELIRDAKGTAIKMIGVNYDITDKVLAIEELKAAKRLAEKAAKAKSDFLANMSHEIRTPMNAILGGLQLLKNANLDGELKHILDNASYSATSLLTIINDILDYSKIESNKIELEQEPFSMNEVLQSVKYDLDSMVSNKGIEFITHVATNFADQRIGDLVRVKQILLNLASNAVKFTNQGSVKIAFDSTSYQDKPAIQIVVSDSGIGMTAEAQEKIFERFSQADSSTTRKFGGTGLGMSITISLIKMMEGAIEVKSKQDVGTTIIVTLPLAAANTDADEKGDLALTPPILRGKKILVAEDNEINQVLIQSMLSPTEAHVELVANGKLAIEALQKQKFDIVLMDIHMPEMDGMEAQQQIKQSNPKLPVIALTANIMVEDVKNYLEKGFASHIGKPIDMNKLYGVLSHYK